MADMIRLQRSGGYTVLPNGILRDTNLSLKTKGLFAIILSLPGRAQGDGDRRVPYPDARPRRGRQVYGRRLHHPGCGGTIVGKPDNG